MPRLTLTNRALDDLCALATSREHLTFVGGTNHGTPDGFESHIADVELHGQHAGDLFEACVWTEVDNVRAVEDHLLLVRRNCPHNDDTPQTKNEPGFVYVLCLTREERQALERERRLKAH